LQLFGGKDRYVSVKGFLTLEPDPDTQLESRDGRFGSFMLRADRYGTVSDASLGVWMLQGTGVNTYSHSADSGFVVRDDVGRELAGEPPLSRPAPPGVLPPSVSTLYPGSAPHAKVRVSGKIAEERVRRTTRFPGKEHLEQRTQEGTEVLFVLHRIEAIDESGLPVEPSSLKGCIERPEPVGAKVLASWGSFGPGDGQFRLPVAIAVDREGNVYVVERGNRRVQKFSSSGAFLAKWGLEALPEAISVDIAGNVFVLHDGGRVQKFSTSGVLQASLDLPQNCSLPRIAADGEGNIYHKCSEKVRKFDPSGSLQAAWEPTGSGDGQVVNAQEITVDGSGNVYVAGPGVVQKFSSAGAFLGSFLVDPVEQFNRTEGVAVDQAGNVYVAEAGYPGRVYKFSPDGTILSKWALQVSLQAIAVDGSGNIYALDRLERVWVLQGNDS